MPNVTIYVRKEDWGKWKSIEDKPTWLQLALAGTDVPKVNRAIKERKKILEIIKPFIHRLHV